MTKRRATNLPSRDGIAFLLDDEIHATLPRIKSAKTKRYVYAVDRRKKIRNAENAVNPEDAEGERGRRTESCT